MGALADRISIRRGMIVTYLFLSVAAATVKFVNADGAGVILVYVSATAFGLFFYAIFGLFPAYISHLFNKGDAALVFAFGNAALGMGGIAGNLVGGYTREFLGSFNYVVYADPCRGACIGRHRARSPSEVRPGESCSEPAV